MKIILGMSFSGSTMFMGYLLVKLFFRNRIPDKMLYFLFKASILYYLIPLLFLKPTFSEVGNFLSVKLSFIPRAEDIMYTFADKSILLEAEGAFILNQVLQKEVTLAVIWCLVGLAIIGIQIAKYLKCRKERAKLIWESPNDHDKMLMQKWKERYKIRRRVELIPVRVNMPTFTQGFFHPVVFYSSVITGETEREMQFQHELIHIKGMDWLWNVLVKLVLCLHWFNPLTWFLLKEWQVVSEDACDGEVLEGRDAEARAVYARMLIGESMAQEKTETPVLSVSLAGNVKGKKNIERRVNKIMNKKVELKGLKKAITLLVVGMLVAMNSLTVYAYDDVQYRTVETSAESGEEAVEFSMDEDWIFVEGGSDEEIEGYWAEVQSNRNAEYIVEWQFIDAEGNVYPFDPETNSYLFCQNHAYVLGEVQRHEKQDDGSCVIKIYEGARCSICGAVTVGALIQTITYNPCTHE